MLTPTSQTHALPEQRAYHSYGSVPRRASAPRTTTTTGEPTASPHRAGFSSGIHPEDRPYITEEQSAEDSVLSPQRAPSSARRYASTTTTTQGPPLAPAKHGHPKAFYTLLVGGSIILGGMLASVFPPLWQRASDHWTYGYPGRIKPMSMWATIPGRTTRAAIFSRSIVTAILKSSNCPKGCRSRASSPICI